MEPSTGATILYGRDVDFSTSIAYLRELDIDRIPVKTIHMAVKFNESVDSNASRRILFANITQHDSLEEINMKLQITYFEHNGTVDFANQRL
eukprot:gene13664-16091_t